MSAGCTTFWLVVGTPLAVKIRDELAGPGVQRVEAEVRRLLQPLVLGEVPQKRRQHLRQPQGGGHAVHVRAHLCPLSKVCQGELKHGSVIVIHN